MGYASCVLNNWEVVDERKPFEVSNLRTLCRFTNSPSEVFPGGSVSPSTDSVVCWFRPTSSCSTP